MNSYSRKKFTQGRVDKFSASAATKLPWEIAIKERVIPQVGHGIPVKCWIGQTKNPTL
jgi:hypothetical protein